jgi:hypothetical protein
MILNIFSTQQQLTAWLTFMASSYVTVNESANGNMFPYIFQKSSITKTTLNTAFLSDITISSAVAMVLPLASSVAPLLCSP